VDVNNGEVLASIDVTLPANFTLPDDYVAEYLFYMSNRTTNLKREFNFCYSRGYTEFMNGINRWVTVKPWQREAMEHAEAKLIAYVASLLSPK